MPLLHLIFMILLGACFLWAVLILSWYVAIPLLIVWIVWGGARLIYAKILSWRYRSATNGCQIHKSEHQNTLHTTIIDADYTELP
ncbi:MAG: hypothetical protein SPL08_04650 [Pseudomonadota bacterium]|nr:hypothetical protein [Pseudomonadota bacterium]